MNLMKLINGDFKDGLIDVCNLPIRECIKMRIDDILKSVLICIGKFDKYEFNEAD